MPLPNVGPSVIKTLFGLHNICV
uniref:Uncharacterized protein n=1 Tax=Rhizophora mucronata TaxID=61149 RepID=A0A2P2QTN4_RHIMU